MKKVYLLVAASVVTGALLAGGFASTASAWDPKGEIKKYVQNVTTNGQQGDADDEASAVSAKPGDTLKYIVTITNTAEEPQTPGHNDLVDIEITDTLPTGVELVSDPAKRELKETIDRLAPGESKTFTYDVKVVKQENGTIKNTACFTGNSDENDAPRNDCDDANVKVTKPQILSTATVLPVTGAGSVLGLFAGVSGLGYIAHRVINRKR